MSIVLGIDTSTAVAVGIAEVSDDTARGRVLATATFEAANHHVEQLMPMIEKALAGAGLGYRDLDRIAVGLGPGPFTGLRVGIVTARILASQLGIPLTGVCSLDVVAAAASLRHAGGPVGDQADGSAVADFVAAIDARRKELYWAHYRAAQPVPTRVAGPEVTAPEDLPAGLPVVGPGRTTRPDLFGEGEALPVDGGVLAAVAHLLTDEGTTPMYLRRPDAAVSTKRKSALTAIEKTARVAK